MCIQYKLQNTAKKIKDLKKGRYTTIMGRFCIIQMSSVLSLLYNQRSLNPNTIWLFIEMDNLILKFKWKHKGPIAKIQMKT